MTNVCRSGDDVSRMCGRHGAAAAQSQSGLGVLLNPQRGLAPALRESDGRSTSAGPHRRRQLSTAPECRRSKNASTGSWGTRSVTRTAVHSTSAETRGCSGREGFAKPPKNPRRQPQRELATASTLQPWILSVRALPQAARTLGHVAFCQFDPNSAATTFRTAPSER